MAYIGRDKGFGQQQRDKSQNHSCPQVIPFRKELNLIRNDIKQFKGPSLERFPHFMFDQIVRKAVFDVFNITPVKPIHLNDLPHNVEMDKSSSPGLPWIESGYKTKMEVMQDPVAFRSIRLFWHNIKRGNKKHATDCCAVKADQPKFRVILDYPATISLQEACFALPLIQAYKEKGFPIVFGRETARQDRRKVYNQFCKAKYIFSPNYQQFDKTIPAWLISLVFDILTLNIDFCYYQNGGIPDASHLHRTWLYLIEYFINTPIRLCNGERYKKNRGVLNGSYLANIIQSIVNWIVTSYALTACGAFEHDIIVMGGNSLVGCSQTVDLKCFNNYVSKFGMAINTGTPQVMENIYESSLRRKLKKYGVF